MSTPKPRGDILQVEVEMLKNGTEQKRRAKKSALTTMTGSKLKTEMNRLTIPDRSNGEAGIMRVQLMQALGLGLPPHKQWTNKSIRYMMETVYGAQYDEKQLGGKMAASKKLKEIIDKDGVQDEPTKIIRYEELAKELEEKGEKGLARVCRNMDSNEQTMSPEMKSIIHDLLEINEREELYRGTQIQAEMQDDTATRALFLDSPQRQTTDAQKTQTEACQEAGESRLYQGSTSLPEPKRRRIQDLTNDLDHSGNHNLERNSTGGSDDYNTNLRRDYAVAAGPSSGHWKAPTTVRSIENGLEFMTRELRLTNDEDGWEQILYYPNIAETIAHNHPCPRMRGQHFYTACAMAIKEIETLQDLTGFGSGVMAMGNEEMAKEWMGLLYLQGVKKMGRGCLFEQIRFSKAARKGLAGAGSNAPDPSHVATFFSQLFQAGEPTLRPHEGSKQPAHHHASQDAPHQRLTLPHAQVPKETIDTILATAKDNAPAGMRPQILETAVRTIAAKPGATFRDKQIGGLKALGQGVRSKEQDRSGYQELDWSTTTTAKQTTNAVVNLSIEALESARITAGNVNLLNTGYDNVKKCILAVIQRKFIGSDFNLHLLVPRTAGVPPPHELKNGFGESERCQRLGAIPVLLTEEEDRNLYMWFRLAMESMIVIDQPSLDFGFVKALQFYSENTMVFQANGTPLCLVTRSLCNLLQTAQRQREQLLIHASHPDETLLTFKETPEISLAKQRLLEWSREGQAEEVIRHQRCMSVHMRSPAISSPSANQYNNDRQSRTKKTKWEGSSSNVKDYTSPDRPWQAPRIIKEKEVTFKQEVEGSINPMHIDQQTWSTKYGNFSNNGERVVLCFHHCNRHRGCTNLRNCSRSHDHLPKAYNGKKFHQLPTEKKMEVVKACSKKE